MPEAQASVQQDSDLLAVNALRFLAVDAVQQANSGHPGMPMGAAAMAFALWSRHLKHDPAAPDWMDRDRFVLSAGHGSMLLYGLLHLFGYDLPMEEIKRFRQWGSRTPGHPENFVTPGVETTTGPLGQGFANGVGMAMAERLLAARFNRPGHTIVDHSTYAIVSDGDLMEGVSHEAASIAGHLGLGKLIYLYDDNGITIDGSTDLSFSENIPMRFEAYGWHVLTVDDGNDIEAIDEAIAEARAENARPSLICVKTHIGFGSPNKQDSSAAHGSPLGHDEVAATKMALGWPTDVSFHVPEEAYAHARSRSNHDDRRAWESGLKLYREAYPALAEELDRWMTGELPEHWDEALPVFAVGDDMASRKASGKALAGAAVAIGNLIGGSADLTPSNNSSVPGRKDQSSSQPEGEYLRFGVREHAMGSLCNGMSLHGGIRPYCATFLVFSDYMRPAIRLSALMGLPVIYVFTHDSIGLGEDGPTHQPVEHVMALRAIPNLTVYRPADAAETSAAWQSAIEDQSGPSAFALSRQGLPQMPETVDRAAEGVSRGAYILRDGGDLPDLILMATGSELSVAARAADRLSNEGLAVRLVSMPSWERFEAQPDSYKDSVLPDAVSARVAIEAGVSLGWERYVGRKGAIIALDRFGASAPADVLFAEFGFTEERVIEAARAQLG